MWGVMAPSRPIPVRSLGLSLYRARSQSEPNLPDMFNHHPHPHHHHASGGSSSGDDELELSFMEEGPGAGDTPLLNASLSHIDHHQTGGKGGSGVTPSHLNSQSLSHLPPQSTPIDKTENIRHYLASLPNITVEDDPGLGENMFASESGSGYSSPISTPTDDDHHLHGRYNKLAKEIRREQRAGGGAGSEHQQQQTLPPPLLEEPLQEEPLQEEEECMEEGAEDASRQQEVVDSPRREDTSAEVLPPPQVTEGLLSTCADKSSPIAPPSPPETRHKEEEERGGGTTTVTDSGERVQPVAQLPVFQALPKPLRSTSLPRNILSQFQDPPNKPLPPPSSSSPPALSVPCGGEAVSPDTIGESVLAEHGSTNISEIVSDSNYELSLSPSEQSGQQQQHQQQSVLKEGPKSDASPLDVSSSSSGLVQLPQIQSVPERIKEIEEMNSLKRSSKSPTTASAAATNTTTTAAGQPVEKKAKCEFFVGDEGLREEPVEARDSASMTRSSSGRSISTSSSLSVAGEEELKQLGLLNEDGSNGSLSKSGHIRHSSLSPNPPSGVTPTSGAGLDAHARTASCSHLPSSMSVSDPLSVTAATSAPSPSSAPQSGGGNEVVELGRGAVKARVLDIEERNRDERSVSSDELSSVTRRQGSPPYQPPPRAASSATIAVGVGPGGGVVIPEAMMSTYEARDLKQLIMVQQRRPSSEIFQQRSSPPASQRETTPPAFLSAWSKLVDEIPIMPVQDLKRKFEESDAASVGGSSIGSGGAGSGSGSTRQCQEAEVRHRHHKLKNTSLKRSQSLRAVDCSPTSKVGPARRAKKSSMSPCSGSGGGRSISPCSQD